jgi:hypothetical protein
VLRGAVFALEATVPVPTMPELARRAASVTDRLRASMGGTRADYAITGSGFPGTVSYRCEVALNDRWRAEVPFVLGAGTELLGEPTDAVATAAWPGANRPAGFTPLATGQFRPGPPLGFPHATRRAPVSGQHPPLGGYPEFARSSGGPFPWGEGDRSRVAYGVDVLPDLVAGLRELPALAAEGLPRKAEPRAGVVGCVYRLTSSEVIDALIPIESCIVVDRQQTSREPLERLHRDGTALTTLFLPGFDEVTLPLPDGSAPVIVPGQPMPDPVELGPVRAAGWAATGRGGGSRPLVHVKMLVAGRSWVWQDDFGYERWHFTALRTWMGSANWTSFAPSHLEFGIWSDDPELLNRNQGFLLDMLRFSQPLDSTTAGPEPELVDANWDDAAFAEYAAEMGPLELDQDEDQGER